MEREESFEREGTDQRSKLATPQTKIKKRLVHNIKIESKRAAEEILEKIQEFNSLLDQLLDLELKEKATEIGSQMQDLLETTNEGLGQCIVNLRREISPLEKEDERTSAEIGESGGTYLDQIDPNAFKSKNNNGYVSTSSLRKKLLPGATSSINQLKIREVLNNTLSSSDISEVQARSEKNLINKVVSENLFVDKEEDIDDVEEALLTQVMKESELTAKAEEQKRKEQEKQTSATTIQEGDESKDFSGEIKSTP